MQQDVDNFLRSHGFDERGGDGERLLADFAGEMEAGLAGRPSSLSMIPSFIEPGRAVPSDQPAIVLDAGGTNLRAAVVSFDAQGRTRVENFARQGMPGVLATVSAEEFFATLADFLMPVAALSDEIGFCFSYAAEITPTCDGRLLKWTKQIRASEVVGRLVGEELGVRLAARGFRHRITVLNDTVATLMAGRAAGMTRRYSSYVGFILGTGTNSAYIERNAAIGKRRDLDPRGEMAVNVESGGFALAPRSRFDEALDATTLDVGTHVFEKTIAGGYLGGLGLTMLRAAADEGLLSSATGRALKAWERLENKDLDDFCAAGGAAAGPFARLELSDGERLSIQEMGRAVYRRSARLAAVNLAAAILRGGGGSDPRRPVCANLDGSTIFKTRSVAFRALLEEHLRALLAPRGVACELLGVDDAPLIGAAVAALTRR